MKEDSICENLHSSKTSCARGQFQRVAAKPRKSKDADILKRLLHKISALDSESVGKDSRSFWVTFIPSENLLPCWWAYTHFAKHTLISATQVGSRKVQCSCIVICNFDQLRGANHDIYRLSDSHLFVNPSTVVAMETMKESTLSSSKLHKRIMACRNISVDHTKVHDNASAILSMSGIWGKCASAHSCATLSVFFADQYQLRPQGIEFRDVKLNQ